MNVASLNILSRVYRLVFILGTADAPTLANKKTQCSVSQHVQPIQVSSIRESWLLWKQRTLFAFRRRAFKH